MDKSLVVAYRYHDLDVVEVSVSAWNGRFGGQTRLYLAQGELEVISKTLAGFPTPHSDTREVVMGAFGTDYAGGGVRLRFSLSDLAGHAQVEISVEADHRNSKRAETAQLLCKIEPASLDSFVSQLHAVSLNLDGSAELMVEEA